MASGPEHWNKALEILASAENADADADARRDDIALLLKFADTHFNAARTAATALQAVLPLIGDDQQVTEWAHAIGVTVDTNQGARITSALFLIDEMEEAAAIPHVCARELRRALGKTPESPASSAEPSAETVEELVELMYQADILDGSEWAADRAASIARALLKAGVRLPAEPQDGGAQ